MFFDCESHTTRGDREFNIPSDCPRSGGFARGFTQSITAAGRGGGSSFGCLGGSGRGIGIGAGGSVMGGGRAGSGGGTGGDPGGGCGVLERSCSELLGWLTGRISLPPGSPSTQRDARSAGR